MRLLRSVLGDELVIDQFPTRILYWRDLNTTHFISRNPRRLLIASAVRDGLHWQAQLFVPGGAYLVETKRTRHEADFAALVHAHRIISHYDL
jgi:hypothetical protein